MTERDEVGNHIHTKGESLPPTECWDPSVPIGHVKDIGGWERERGMY